ncbi:MAG: response regulator [Pseudomonadota bacterium]
MSNMATNNQAMHILLVEDDDVSVESVVRSLRKHDVEFPMTIAQDGQEALEILRNQHPTHSIKRPFLILLDLNMPRMNGFEFLEAIRSDAALKSSIVFILTTSDSDSDRSRAYNDNIAGYMVKSSVGPQFSKLALLLRNYQAAVRLPE